jgi:hypothetical protein
VAVCLYHPDRQGIGVCVRCRVVICAECCTRLDGINHCHSCLKALGTRPVPRRQASSALLTALVVGALCLAFFGVFWLARGNLAP